GVWPGSDGGRSRSSVSRSPKRFSACSTSPWFPMVWASCRASVRYSRACLDRDATFSSVAYFRASSALIMSSKISLGCTGSILPQEKVGSSPGSVLGTTAWPAWPPRCRRGFSVLDVQFLQGGGHLPERALELHQLHQIARDSQLAAHVRRGPRELVLGEGHSSLVVLGVRGVPG